MNKENLEFLLNKINNYLQNNREFRTISWLYLVKLHPSFLKNYESIFKDRKYLKNNFYYILNLFFRIIKLNIYFIFITLFKKKIKYPNLISNQYDILVISHLLNEKSITDENDYIFSNIKKYLKTNNFEILFVYLNHTSINFKQNFDKIILTKSLGLIINFKYLSKYILLFLKSFFKKIEINSNKDILFKRKLNLEILSSSNIYNEIFTDQIKDILIKKNIKNLLITYEGYAWERILINKIKSLNLNINCLAYNHSGIWKGQNSMKIDMGYDYNPDYIFFPGLKHKERFYLNNNYNTKTEILGSNRNLLATNKDDMMKNDKLKVLFLPEGIITEFKIFLKLAIKLSNTYNDIDFIFRSHPILKSKIKNYYKNFLIPKNLIFSNNTFSNDLIISNIAIYRGSTTCISALRNRVIPVYYDISDNINIDFMYDLNEFKYVIKNDKDFSKIINNFNYIINNHKVHEDEIVSYCNEIFEENFKFDKLKL